MSKIKFAKIVFGITTFFVAAVIFWMLFNIFLQNQIAFIFIVSCISVVVAYGWSVNVIYDENIKKWSKSNEQ